MVKLVLLTLLLELSVGIARAEFVCSVHDGDTIRVIKSGFKDCNTGHTQSIRFWGVDAPELKQPLGTQSRDYLKSLVLHKEVQLICTGKNFNRKVCQIYLPANQPDRRISVESAMVENGWAYDSAKYSRGLYEASEAVARAKQVGVWALPDGGVRPWVWRKTKRLKP